MESKVGSGHGGLHLLKQEVVSYPMTGPTITVRDFRRLWKPHKEQLNGVRPEHPTNVRFHRCCSWLQRAEQMTDAGDLDLSLLNRWIAFNALYGQWDHAAREPVSDKECWQHFLERALALDQRSHIVNALMDNKPLIMSILDDEFLSRYYWQAPTGKRASQSKKAKYEARTWYLQGNWLLILDRLFERIYLLRCQLVHGAATYNSALNRNAIRHCSQALDHLLRSFLLIWVDFGAEEDWGIMCYPPLRSQLVVRYRSSSQACDRAPDAFRKIVNLDDEHLDRLIDDQG